MLAAGGFFYWFMHPKTQMKRKTHKILNAFSVSPGESAGVGNALFADGLYADSVKIEINTPSTIANYLQKFIPLNNLSRDHIVAALQHKNNYIKELVHSPGDLLVQKIDESTYTVTFPDTVQIAARKLPLKETLKLKVAFTFSKIETQWLLSSVLLNAP